MAIVAAKGPLQNILQAVYVFNDGRVEVELGDDERLLIVIS